MKYRYEDLSDDQFEGLVVLLCQKLLGISVQPFSKGPDGGRDAKFVGTAELFPSKAAPWVGTTIIQAKHTNGYNRDFSETDFFTVDAEKAKNTVLGKEIPRIEKLRKQKQLDHYMLFANRRLAANAESKIREHLASKCGIPEQSIYLCGVEQLETWLKSFPKVPQMANLDPIDSPLIVSPDDLAEVVQALAKWDPGKVFDDAPTARVSYAEKNQLNSMSEKYAETLQRRFLKDSGFVRTFLAAPENLELLRTYESAVEEFELKIIAKRKDYQSFDEVMNYLTDLLFARDPVLRQVAHKRLTRLMLFYMYWNCDIGRVEDVATN